MDERIKKWLLDILSAIDEIDQFFNTYPKSFESFQTNCYASPGYRKEPGDCWGGSKPDSGKRP